MADLNLRKKLAAMAGMAIDNATLDAIYERLMNVEEGKIPLTLKFVFSVDKEGQLEVSFKAQCNLTLHSYSVNLRSDGRQLTLPMAEEPIVMEATTPEPKAARPSVRDLGDPAYTPPDPVPVPGAGADAASERVKARIEGLRRQAEDLYRQGKITVKQAKLAGVDVEALERA